MKFLRKINATVCVVHQRLVRLVSRKRYILEIWKSLDGYSWTLLDKQGCAVKSGLTKEGDVIEIPIHTEVRWRVGYDFKSYADRMNQIWGIPRDEA